MHRDDALLSIERYATSKVYTDQDLFSIRTLGFRGEALPSIAAVSRFSLMTRSAESETGTRITMEGGKIMAVTDVGAPRGTTIVVKDLFYNIPARRKFLKTIATEMSHIADTVTHMALGWPSVQFRMLHNGRILKDWPSTGQTKERMLDILGGDLAQGQGLHEIRFQDEWIKISGWLSSPDIWRTSTRSIFVYVNGRFVKNRNMQQALCEGFRGRLIKGRYPVAMVFLEVPFDRLDVNVHPTKNEVRFVDQDRVYTALRSTVIKSLQLAGQPKWRRSEDGAQVFSPNDDYQIRNKEFFHIEKTPAQIPPAKTEDLPCAFNDKKFSVVQSQDIAAEVP
jgi:DNA mismatch repair protein MutL